MKSVVRATDNFGDVIVMADAQIQAEKQQVRRPYIMFKNALVKVG